MGKENFIPRSDPENPNKRVDAEGAHIDIGMKSPSIIGEEIDSVALRIVETSSAGRI